MSCWHRYNGEAGVGPESHVTTREKLAEFIAKSTDDIKKLFSYKNTEYGADADAFSNFRKTANRVLKPFMEKHGVTVDEKELMFLVALTLADKHLVALSHTGVTGNEVDERLQDVANYCLIMRGMLREGK
jgi:phosphotransferase system HPr-like phosphotransfer protein